MTTAELGLATKSAATLSTSPTLEELMCHSSGKSRSPIEEPGDAIAPITPSKFGPQASWTLSSFPLPGDSPFSMLGVMSVTSVSDARHGRSTELQAIMQIIEA
jgi:hypothetical protein